MAAGNRKIVVEVVGDATGLRKTISQVEAQTTGLQKRLTTGKIGSLGKGLALGLGIGAIGALTTGVELAIGKLGEMHDAFLAGEVSQVNLANVIKNSVKDYESATVAAEAYAAAMIDMGFADDDTRASLQQTIGVTKDLAQAQKLTNLAMDVARAKGIDLATATNAVTKGYLGQGRSLQALGVNLRGATTGTEILARAQQTFKDAAVKYTATGAGIAAKQQARLGEAFERVGGVIDTISRVLIPVFAAGLSEIIDVSFALGGGLVDLATNINTVLGPAFVAIGNIISFVIGLLSQAYALATGLIGIVDKALGGGQHQEFNVPGAPSVTSTKYGVPVHHDGGIVAGALGSNQLILAQAGERVTPRGQGGPQIIVNIESFIGSDRDIDRFADRLAFRLRATSLS